MVTRQEVNRDIALMEPNSKIRQVRPLYHREFKLQGDLGLTNLELFWIIVGLEDKYQVTIPQEKIESLVTLDNLVEYVVDMTNWRSQARKVEWD